jgi:hypothetical protein
VDCEGDGSVGVSVRLAWSSEALEASLGVALNLPVGLSRMVDIGEGVIRRVWTAYTLRRGTFGCTAIR